MAAPAADAPRPGDPERVLEEIGDDWVDHFTVIQDSGLHIGRANRALRDLEGRGLIEQERYSNPVRWRRTSNATSATAPST